MKIAKGVVLNERADLKEQIKSLDVDLNKLFEFAKGRVRFGGATDRSGDSTSGNRGENIEGAFLTYSSNVGADTEDTVAHGLTNTIPIGFIVLKIDKGGVVYDSGTAWTTTNMFLKCSTASTTALLFLLK